MHRQCYNEPGTVVCAERLPGKIKIQGDWLMRQKQRTSCETCAFYVYDEEYESYLCDMNMDEDDYVRIMSERYFQCPYYRNGDDYAVVRKQM